MNKDEEPIIVEARFNTSSEKVWNAITDIDQMRQWYFKDIPAFKPVVGFETRFDVRSQDRIFPHVWKVTEVVPLKLIAYNWKYEGYQGDSNVVFELFKLDNSTTLRLTHSVMESFSSDIPEFSRESGVDGWTFFIRTSLKDFLAKNY